MSDVSSGPGWWQASDGRWYPPEQHPHYVVPPSSGSLPSPAPGSPYPGSPPPASPHPGSPSPGSPYAGSPYPAPYGSSPYATGQYGAPPYGVPGPFGPGAAPPPRTSGLAIASLVCSLLAFLLAGLPAIVGVIMGFTARSQIRRSNGTQSGAGLALAGIIVGLAEIVAVVVLIVALVNVVVTHERQQQIAGAPAYTTFSGPTGRPMAEGRPWGETCEPIVFQAASGMPDAIYTQLQQVVLMARASGVDATVAIRQDRWFPTALYPAGLTDRSVQFVSVFTDTGTPPLLAFGQPEHIQFEWNARTTTDGTHAILTYLQADMYLQVLTTPLDIRRAVRQLIAFSQGVAGSSAPGSGIASGSTVDGFSAEDYAAMRTMSGCRHPPP